MDGTTRTDIDMKRTFGVGGVAVLAALLLGGGCAKRADTARTDEPAPAGQVSEYYPLAVGNQWTYRINGRDDKRVTIQVTREEGGYFHDNRDGQLAVDAYGLRDPKRYLLRGPVREGTTWTNVVSVSSTERYHIARAGGPCEVPAGTFPNCVEVEGRNRVDAKATVVNTMTFAAGVGMVRVQVALETDGQRVPQTSLELVGWKLQDGKQGGEPSPEPAPAG